MRIAAPPTTLLLAAAAALAAIAPPATASAPQESAANGDTAVISPVRIDLRFAIRPDLPAALIEADLTFVAIRPTDTVELALRSDFGLDVVEDGDGVPLPYERQRGFVRIATPRLEAGVETKWTFRYRARFDSTLEESGQLLLTNPWYPHLLVSPDPTEFLRYVPMPMTLTATLPRPWVLVSAGTNSLRRNDDDTITYDWRDSVPSPQIPLAIGPFLQRDKLAMVGTLRGFFPLRHQSVIETYVDYVDAAATFFTERIGTLDRRTWNLIALELPDAMSGVTFPGVTLLEVRDVDPEGAFPYRVLAHEIAHQWWNHAVEIPRPRDAWLREGLPTYSALLFLESTYGNQMMRLELDRSQRVALAVNSQEPLELGFEMQSPDAIYAFNYHKATVVLHMLRSVMGLDGFTRLSRALHGYDDDVTTQVFVELAGDIHGEDLSWFFDPWLQSAAVPSFDVRYGYRAAEGNASRYELFGTITQRDAEVRFPVLVRIPLEAAPPLETTVWIEPGVTEFSIVLPSPPRDLQFDPYGDLLYREITMEPVGGAAAGGTPGR